MDEWASWPGGREVILVAVGILSCAAEARGEQVWAAMLWNWVFLESPFRSCSRWPGPRQAWPSLVSTVTHRSRPLWSFPFTVLAHFLWLGNSFLPFQLTIVNHSPDSAIEEEAGSFSLDVAPP